MTEATIAHVQSVIAQKGTDAWWQLPLEDLLPADLRDQAPRLKKGEDTMVRAPRSPCCMQSVDLRFMVSRRLLLDVLLLVDLWYQAPQLKKGEDTIGSHETL